MSTKSIWNALRAGGMTAAGAAAMMGNMMAESAMRSNNAQDCFNVNDDEYTRDIDNGRIDRAGFANGKIGYGLCQWTEPSRQRNLYEFAVKYGASIGDEAMQVAFCLYEFPSVAPDTWKMCCTSDDIYKCTYWICYYYENPAVKNVDDRYKFAMQFYNEFADSEITEICESCTINTQTSEEAISSVEITVPVLRRGDKGMAVLIAQCAMTDMKFPCGNLDGDFGSLTESAVNSFKSCHNLKPNGEIDRDMWQIIFQ